MAQNYDFTITQLGTPKIDSPIAYSRVMGDSIANYVTETERIIYDVEATEGERSRAIEPGSLLEKAGPREKLYFKPSHVHAAIVTCGGLCPGLNDVIRAIVRCLWDRYGVRRISGIMNGYKGFLPEYNFPIMELTPDEVDDIHKMGGTILGSSRGGGTRTEELADAIERLNINMLFTIGGDGTQKGSLCIAEELEKRGLKISVVGIPKTIDNDLSFTQRSFGFDTAVAKAVEAVASAHTEAASAINGIGLVKVMGRESGFIAAQTAIAVHEANFVLIPEVPFELEGENGFLSHLKKRLLKKDHAVILVAEGAGQELFTADDLTDASGNKILKDIGVYLKERLKAFFKEDGMEVNIKYIDPSYIIRSAPAIPNDASYCTQLGNNAVHAAMAGKTKLIIGLINNAFVHVPTKMAVTSRKKVEPEGSLWRDVIEATHQPLMMVNPK